LSTTLSSLRLPLYPTKRSREHYIPCFWTPFTYRQHHPAAHWCGVLPWRRTEGRANRSSAAASCSTKISLHKAYHGDSVRIFARIRVRRNVCHLKKICRWSLFEGSSALFWSLVRPVWLKAGRTFSQATVFPQDSYHFRALAQSLERQTSALSPSSGVTTIPLWDRRSAHWTASSETPETKQDINKQEWEIASRKQKMTPPPARPSSLLLPELGRGWQNK